MQSLPKVITMHYKELNKVIKKCQLKKIPLKCPKCKAITKVVQTRKDIKFNKTVRRRRCTKCNYRFYTIDNILKSKTINKIEDGKKIYLIELQGFQDFQDFQEYTSHIQYLKETIIEKSKISYTRSSKNNGGTGKSQNIRILEN